MLICILHDMRAVNHYNYLANIKTFEVLNIVRLQELTRSDGLHQQLVSDLA
jgi:hypothetical protein